MISIRLPFYNPSQIKSYIFVQTIAILYATSQAVQDDCRYLLVDGSSIMKLRVDSESEVMLNNQARDVSDNIGNVRLFLVFKVMQKKLDYVLV